MTYQRHSSQFPPGFWCYLSICTVVVIWAVEIRWTHKSDHNKVLFVEFGPGYDFFYKEIFWCLKQHKG